MNNFNFYSPTEFIFGKDTENECGKYVKKYGGTKVLIHYGSGSAVKSGLIGRVEKSLTEYGIPFVSLAVFSRIREILRFMKESSFAVRKMLTLFFPSAAVHV